MGIDYVSASWFLYLDHSMRDLVEQAMVLDGREEAFSEEFHDYSYLVFPMAKAYEGFLKKFFVDLGLVSEQIAYGKHFRIGKSLNPSLPDKYKKDDYVYDRLGARCGDGDLAKEMWEGWRKSRNMLFHYFPKHKKFVGRDEARARVADLASVMSRAVGCLN